MEQIQRDVQDIAGVSRDAAAANPGAFGRFTAWCAAVVAIGALLVMAFVILVDPYHLFGLVDAEGFNRVKPRPEQYREQIKVSQAQSFRPKGLLLGNSRTEWGFDPDSGVLQAHGFPTYNLGLSDTGLVVSQRAFEQLRQHAGAPAMAVIGVEFLDFLVKPDQPPPAPDAAQGQSWEWRLNTLFSLKSLSDAARTVLIQKAPEVETMTASGHAPLLEYRKFAREEGYNAIFMQRAQENAKSLVRKPHNLFVKASGSSESIESLRKLLRTMAQDGTEVHLLIYPYHAQLMAMFDEAGLKGVMEEWKAMLAREVDAVRRDHPDARISLWDFSGFGPIQCEPIPPPGDLRTSTKWYWEAGHFKSATGDLVLRRMLGEAAPFGFALTSENLAQNRERIAAEQARCAAAIPATFAEARAMVAEARRHAH